MYKNYDSLGTSRDTWLKNGVGGDIGSSPHSRFSVTMSSWLVVLLVFMSMTLGQQAWAQSAANYTFATNTTGSLALDMNSNAIDMSTGTTTLVAAGLDATASAVTNIGFDFYLMGNRFTQFGVQEDGIMRLGGTAPTTNVYTITGGTLTAPLLSALNADFRTGTTTGKIHYKLVGIAPNRVLVVEFLNMQLFYTSTGTAGTSTWQMRLYENGNIEYVYGTVSATDVTTTDRAPSIGFYTGSATNSFVSVAYATSTASTTSPYAANPNIAATGVVTGLNSATDGSRRTYQFLAAGNAGNAIATTLAAPTALNFTGVGTAAMTLNWTAASPATGVIKYAVFRSTDGGATYTYVNTTTVGTNTLAVTGLTPSTTYNWRVYAISEGGKSTNLDGVQATNAPGTYTSTTSGNWSAGATWVGGVAPSSLDSAVIADGTTVTLDVTGISIVNLTVGQGTSGILTYGTTPTTVTVTGNLTVAAGGALNCFNGTTGKNISVAGNITNNGTIDLSVGTTTVSALTLNGTAVQTVSGSGSFVSNIVRNLTFNNTTVTSPNINWNMSGVMVGGTLTFTAGKVALGSKLTLGSGTATGTGAAAIGALSYTAGGFTSGTFSRYWAVTGNGTTITPGADPTAVGGRYPFISGTGINRSAFIDRSAPLAAGQLSCTYADASTNSAVSIADGAYTVGTRYDGKWTFSLEGSSYTGSNEVALMGSGAYVTTAGNSRVLLAAAAAAGTHQAGTTTPGAQRVMSQTDLTAGALYIGAANAEIPFTSATSGDWSNASTWNKGTVPTCTDNIIIVSGHNVTVNSASNVSKGVTINSGGTLTVASGDLTVGCTNNNTPLVNNGTLTVSGGTLNINGNLNVASTTAVFNQSGGTIKIDGNAGGSTTNSVAASTALFGSLSNKVNLTGGTLLFVDPHTSTTASTGYTMKFDNGTAVTASLNASPAHITQFGDGVSTDAGGHTSGFYIDPWTTTAYLSLGSIVVNGGSGTNRQVGAQYQLTANGDVTINAGSTLNPASSLLVGRNLTVNAGGTFINTTGVVACILSGNDGSTLTFAPTTNAQTFTNNGTISNLATGATANFTALQVNNSNASGLTLNSPFSVSGTLTMTLGLINTTSANLLTLGTASASGTLSGTPSATNMIVGPFARTFAASRTAAGTYTVAGANHFPVGKAGSYRPIFIDPTTSAGGAVVFSGETFDTNSGTQGSGVTSLSAHRFEALPISGAANLTSTNVRLSDGAIVSSNKILQSASAAGAYGPILPATTFAAGIVTTASQIAVANYNGYFAYGDITACVAPTDQATAFLASNITNTTFTGSYTAAASAPTGYLVVRNASGGTFTNPTDYTIYTAGGALGTGTVAYAGTATTFNATGLTAGTTYDYKVYSYANTACAGPVYNVATPLAASVTTCATAIGTPGTPTASAIATTSLTASWTASSTPGVDYVIDVATNSGFTTFVPGYQNLNVGTGILTTNITGLSVNTTYYIRVKAINGVCSSPSTSTLTVTTYCLSNSVPSTVETFTDTTLPSCWSTSLLSGATNWATATTNDGVPSPRTGTYFMGKVYTASDALLVSPPIDMTTAGVTGARINVWIYRNTLNKATDRIRFYANTSQNLTGASQLLEVFPLTTVAPTVAAAGWYNYTANIPGTFSGATALFIIAEGTTDGSFTSYGIGFDDFAIENIPSCNTPGTISSSAVTSTSATISWVAASPAPGNGYEYEVRTSGAAGSGGTGLDASGSTLAGVVTANVAGLTAATTYSVYVRSSCGGGDFSVWTPVTSLVTACNASGVPYTENFNSATAPALPACTSVINVGSGNVWTTNAGGSAYGFPTNALRYSYNDTAAADTWFFTRGITLVGGTSYTIKYKYGAAGATYPERLKVAYGSSASAGAMTNPIADYTNIVNVTPNSEEIAFTPASSGDYYFGFNAYSLANEFYLFVDDISIDLSPTCLKPTAVTISAVASTTATVSWTASTSAPASGYEYEVRTSGAAGSGATGLVTSGSILAGVVTANASGLSATTAYSVYVRSNCGAGDFSAWTDAKTFTTLCATAPVPVNEGLNSASLSCWTKTIVTDNDTEDDVTPTLTYVTASSNPTGFAPEEGTGFYRFNSYNCDVNDQIRFSSSPISTTGVPSVDVDFKWLISGYTNNDNVQVQYSLNGTSWINAGAPITRSGVVAGVVTQAWTSQTVILPPAAGNQPVIYVGLLFTSAYGNDCYIDDLQIKASPPCVAPTGVIASNLTTTTATISWAAAATAPTDGYEYEVRTSGAAGSGATGLAATGTTVTAVLTANLTGLVTDTDYSVYVRSVCDGGTNTYSGWSVATVFRTGYCSPSYTPGKTDGSVIANVLLAGTTLSNNTGIAAVNPAYTYFTGASNLTANIQAGTSYNLSVTVGTVGSQGVAVWIDSNDDLVFDSSERIGFTATSIAASSTGVIQIQLPCTATPGLHRMRIREANLVNGNVIDPCGNVNNGETEDYDVTVTAAAACPQPSALVVSAITNTSATMAWTTGCSETSWDTYVVTAGSPAPTTSTTATVGVTSYGITLLSAGTAYDVYVRAVCGAGSESLWTGPVRFTTTGVPANDNFANAMPLVCGTTKYGSTTSATNDQPNPAAFGVSAALSPNVWFSYTGTGSPESITLSLCGSSYDTAILVATGTAGSLTYIAGNDDSASCTPSTRSVVNFNSNGTTTYWIMVRGYDASSTSIGSYELVTSCAAACTPVTINDECSTAEALTLSTPYSTNNACATASANSYPTCGSQFASYYDTWYTFNSGAYTALRLSATHATSVEIGFAVYSGTCGGTLTQLYCSTTGAITDMTGLTTSTNYYVRVFSIDSSKRGNFDLQVGLTPCTITTTWDGTAWSNGYPVADQPAAITGNYTATADLSACSLSVTGTAVVSVPSGFDFNITGTVSVASGASLTFENNANLIQAGTANNNTGKITSKRNTTMRRLDYTYWSSPVAGQQLKAFSPQTVSPPIGTSRFYKFSETTNAFDSSFDPAVTNFAAATGYSVRAPNNFPVDLSPAPFEGTFNGVPNNGNYIYAMTKTATPGANGYNLIGNPYPSPIDASLFLATTPGTIYLWTHYSQAAVSGANYASYNTVGGTAAVAGGPTPNGIIQTGQGFLFLTSAAGNATFTNAMRVGNNAGQFFKTASDKSRIWLNLTGPTEAYNQILIGYMDNATNGVDESIDGKQFPTATSSISSILDNTEYVIQGRPSFTDSDIVPLGFKASTAGTYSIGIDHVDGLFSGSQVVFLRDNLTGTVQNIKQNGYSFASAEGAFNSRFEVIYQSSPLANPTFDVNNVIVYKASNMLNINSGSVTMSTVKIFDVRGRMIYERDGINATTASLNDLKAEQQVLIVQITSDDNRTVTKKVVY